MPQLRREIAAYLRQQVDGGMPDIIFAPGFLAGLQALMGPPAAVPSAGRRGVASPQPVKQARIKRPLTDLHAMQVLPKRPADSPKREELKKLYFEVQKCTQCPLAKTRKSAVFGAGSVDAPLLIVGEAPGADEDASGLPFVGRAGKLLTDMLAAIKLDRARDVFITNVLKCRPPDNRTPESAEVMKCMPVLRRQIEILKPAVILLLGRSAASALLGSAASIASLRGTVHMVGDIPAIVTYHPAALLRQEQYKRPAWEDLKRVAALLAERTGDHASQS